MPKRATPQAPLVLDPTMPGKERRATIDTVLQAMGRQAMTADGWDDAIVGLGTIHPDTVVVVYDLGTMLDTLMQRDGMDYHEAWEYLSYNVTSAYVGPGTPMFLERVDTL